MHCNHLADSGRPRVLACFLPEVRDIHGIQKVKEREERNGRRFERILKQMAPTLTLEPDLGEKEPPMAVKEPAAELQ